MEIENAISYEPNIRQEHNFGDIEMLYKSEFQIATQQS
jgi:hypothetical protein